MDFKTIVVHLDASGGSAARMAFAARLAGTCQAHLVGVTQTGISRFVYETAIPGVDLSGLTPLFQQLRAEADGRAQAFDAAATAAGLASFEHVVGDEDPGTALTLQAMYADLVIVGRAPAAGGDQPLDAAIPEYVAMNAPCPVLVLPQVGTPPAAFGRVLIAWNASPEAARAVRLALPLLVRAAEVEVAVFDEADRDTASGSAADRIAGFLARHGVRTRLAHHHARGEVGAALLVLAGERKADLLVMGCYGHSRLREVMLGGVSRCVLRRVMVPTLLAH
jgi:nucleotide-binding universal stress UspA family protein